MELGCEGLTTPSQVTVLLARYTNAGTETTTTAPSAEDSQAPASVSTVDTVWSTNPSTINSTLIKRTFDVLAESPWFLELPDEIDTGLGGSNASSGTGINSLALTIADNAVAAGGIITWTLYIDE